MEVDMEPPPFPDVTEAILQAIAAHHGLDVAEFALLPETGLFNRIYRMGDDLILRISRVHPKSFDIARREAVAVPLGRASGMRTPALLACDLSGAVVPAPYTIYERIRGETLGLLNLEPHDTPEVWRELGRDLALLHAHTADMEPPPEDPAVFARIAFFHLVALPPAGRQFGKQAGIFVQILRVGDLKETHAPEFSGGIA